MIRAFSKRDTEELIEVWYRASSWIAPSGHPAGDRMAHIAAGINADFARSCGFQFRATHSWLDDRDDTHGQNVGLGCF